MQRPKGIILPLLVSILFCLVSDGCRKDPIDPEGSTICSVCLPGNWELVRGVKLIGSDTIELFESNKVFSYRYGVRESYVTEDRRILKIGVDTFHYEVSSYQPEPWKDTTGAAHNWKWLDSEWSKTFLNMRLRFNSADDCEVFRILRLDATDLEIEYHRGWGLTATMYCHFRRTADSPVPAVIAEPRVRQLPSSLPGAWKLEFYLQQYNDSIYTTVNNDTLTYQYYQFHYSHYTPGYYTKEIMKSHYRLNLTLGSDGACSLIAADDSLSRTTVGYWYWTDNLSPHRKLYVEPMVASIITDYGFSQASQDEFELKYQDYIRYRFRRVQ